MELRVEEGEVSDQWEAAWARRQRRGVLGNPCGPGSGEDQEGNCEKYDGDFVIDVVELEP